MVLQSFRCLFFLLFQLLIIDKKSGRQIANGLKTGLHNLTGSHQLTREESQDSSHSTRFSLRVLTLTSDISIRHLLARD